MKRLLFSTAAAAVVVGAAFNLSAANEAGFVPLFNGKDTGGWNLRRADGHNSWTIDNGVLKNTVNKGEHGTDLVTAKKFWKDRKSVV